MEKYIKNHKKLIISGIFICFCIIVLFQNRYLYLFHDDFGYASLSYNCSVADSNGHNNSLLKICEFLIEHYKKWGGRILYFFIECVCLNINLNLYRILQALVITGIAVYIYKIVKYYIKNDSLIIALLSCASYGLIQLATFKSGIFWITASVLYLFPILFVLAFFYYSITKKGRKLDGKVKKILYEMFLIILVFLASFSQEQISALIVGYTFLCTISKMISNKTLKVDYIAYFIVALIGFGILMLAPGSKVRMETDEFYKNNILNRILIATPGVLINIYGDHDKIIVSLFFIISLICSCNILKRSEINKWIKWLVKISLISTSIMLILTNCDNSGYFFNLDKYTFSKISLNIREIIIVLQTILWVIPIGILLIVQKNLELLYLFLGSLASQCVMFNSSYYPLRSMLPLDYIFFVIMIYEVFQIKEEYIKVFAFSLICIALINIGYITYGYRINSGVNLYNDNMLKNISQEIINGNDNIKEITLKKVLIEDFAGELPYQKNYQYIEYWIKKYYNLPNNIKFIYE